MRIHHANGSETECALILDPEPTPDGLTQWFAEAPPGTVYIPGADSIRVAVLPPRTTIRLVLHGQPDPD